MNKAANSSENRAENMVYKTWQVGESKESGETRSVCAASNRNSSCGESLGNTARQHARSVVDQPACHVADASVHRAEKTTASAGSFLTYLRDDAARGITAKKGRKAVDGALGGCLAR